MSRKRESKVAAIAGEAEAFRAASVARDFVFLTGYSQIQGRLIQLRMAGTTPPVLLFVGRDGLGKRRLAGFAAALYSCVNKTGCGECPECRELIAGKNPELIWVEASDGPIKIEQIASLQEHLSYSPGSGGSSSRIAVIVDADKMTEQAANRILKTLEEPPEKARIILTTSRPGALLPTILSRVVRWNVPPPPRVDALCVIKKMVEEVLPGATAQQISEALDRAGGSPGRALGILADIEAHAVAGEAVRRFLLEEDVAVQLRLSEEFARIFGWSAIHLADMCEWELNRIYRGGDSATLDVLKIHDRRAMLSRVRWLAGRRQINLNTQLMAEGIALGRRVI